MTAKEREATLRRAEEASREALRRSRETERARRVAAQTATETATTAARAAAAIATCVSENTVSENVVSENVSDAEADAWVADASAAGADDGSRWSSPGPETRTPASPNRNRPAAAVTANDDDTKKAKETVVDDVVERVTERLDAAKLSDAAAAAAASSSAGVAAADFDVSSPAAAGIPRARVNAPTASVFSVSDAAAATTSARSGGSGADVAAADADVAVHIDSFPPLWVTRWVDYTSKYGLGYVISDGTFGVMFNDATKMVQSPDDTWTDGGDVATNATDVDVEKANVANAASGGGDRLEYRERARRGGKAPSPPPSVFSEREISAATSAATSSATSSPSLPEGLEKKVKLMRHFRGYLTQARSVVYAGPRATASARRSPFLEDSFLSRRTVCFSPPPRVPRWFQSRHTHLNAFQLHH